MPSSRIGQIALIIGEIVTDTEICYGVLNPKLRDMDETIT